MKIHRVGQRVATRCYGKGTVIQQHHIYPELWKVRLDNWSFHWFTDTGLYNGLQNCPEYGGHLYKIYNIPCPYYKEKQV